MTRQHSSPPKKRRRLPPFAIEDLTKSIVETQGLALESDYCATVLYCRAGLQLVQLRATFRDLGRRDFCEYTLSTEIKPWFRKRAMKIARHHKTEDACQGLTVHDALLMATRSRPLRQLPLVTGHLTDPQPGQVMLLRLRQSNGRSDRPTLLLLLLPAG